MVNKLVKRIKKVASVKIEEGTIKLDLLPSVKVLMCVPVYHQMDKVVGALAHLSNLEVPEGCVLDLMIGVNGASDEFLDYIAGWVRSRTASSPFNTVQYVVFGSNLGKGMAVNSLYSRATAMDHYDKILSMDSDIVFKDKQILVKLLEAHRAWGYGAVAAEQEGTCCHAKNYLKITKVGGHTFRSYKNNEGVAGGVLLVDKKLWSDIGGYQAFNKYGSDDAHFMLDCANLGIVVPVVEGAKVFHPSEGNSGYAEWKVRSCRGELAEDEQEGFDFK